MQYFREGRELLAQLGIEPAYIVGPLGNPAPLSEAQERFLEWQADDTLAMTSPVTDLWFKDTALRYDWAGRGPCIVFCQNPFVFSLEKFLGTCLHETGHWLDYCDHPSRDDVDHERAKRNGTVKGEYHSRRWLKAVINLWHRACRMGYEIPLEAATRFDVYGYTRRDLRPLLDEASRREDEDIESILRGRGVASDRGGITQPQATTWSWPRAEMVAGNLVQVFLDGHIETCPSLDGRQPVKRFDSMRAYYNSLDKVA